MKKQIFLMFGIFLFSFLLVGTTSASDFSINNPDLIQLNADDQEGEDFIGKNLTNISEIWRTNIGDLDGVDTNFFKLSGTDNLGFIDQFVNQSGDTMTGNLNFENFVNITNPYLIQFNTSEKSVNHNTGQLYYNSDGTLSVDLDVSDVSLQIGQEIVFRAKNDEGSQINNGDAVYISGFNSNSGVPEVKLAKADNNLTTSDLVGLATHDINNNAVGYISTLGKVRFLNTSSYNVGDELWLSDTTFGEVTRIEPHEPNYSIFVGHVGRSSATEGIIELNPNDRQIGDHKNGSVIFSDGDEYRQDNSNFFWDNVQNFLGIGTDNPQNELNVIGDINTTGNLYGNGSQLTGLDFVQKSGDTMTGALSINESSLFLNDSELKVLTAGGVERFRVGPSPDNGAFMRVNVSGSSQDGIVVWSEGNNAKMFVERGASVNPSRGGLSASSNKILFSTGTNDAFAVITDGAQKLKAGAGSGNGIRLGRDVPNFATGSAHIELDGLTYIGTGYNGLFGGSSDSLYVENELAVGLSSPNDETEKFVVNGTSRFDDDVTAKGDLNFTQGSGINNASEVNFNGAWTLRDETIGGISRLLLEAGGSSGDSEMALLPKGSSSRSEILLSNAENLNNYNGISLESNENETLINSEAEGNANSLPFLIQTNGTDAIQIDTGQKVTFPNEVTGTGGFDFSGGDYNLEISGSALNYNVDNTFNTQYVWNLKEGTTNKWRLRYEGPNNDRLIWQNGDSEDVLRLNQGGGVEAPQHTKVIAERITSGQTISSGSYQTIVFNFEDVDVNNEYNTSNGKFVVDEAGYYQLSSGIATENTNYNAGDLWILRVFVNGNGERRLVRTEYSDAISTLSEVISGSTLLKLDAGDEVEVKAFHNVGSNRDVRASSGTYLTIHRVP